MRSAVLMRFTLLVKRSRWIRRSLPHVGVLASMALCTTPVLAQAPSSPANDVESELLQVREENALIREQLRRLEEQQKTLLQVVGALERRIDAPHDPLGGQAPPSTPQAKSDADPAAQAGRPTIAPTPATPNSNPAKDQPDFPYDDGIVLVKTRDDARWPILLKLWDVTQLRYTNTLLGNNDYTDHLGAVRPVIRRNDFSLNRNLIQFVGYIFDKRLQFNLIGWASNSSAAFVEGGYVSWRFNKAIGIYAGYWGSPGTRSLTGTFPYFVQLDRSMADQFFRPGFTQGSWIDGEFWKGLHYELFVGNGLNTLTIPSTKIDPHLVYSGSVWWEPLGVYGTPGRARGMYDDYDNRKKPVIRLGTSYTKSRENRFSNVGQDNPENTGLYNSDGVNTFATGAFAPGVTVNDATYRMLAIDGGVKWRGLAVNAQYFSRWLNNFTADGPLPLKSTFDQGFEFELSKFVIPKKWELYGRTSFVFGQFANSYEYAPGVKWYIVPNHRVWLIAEGLRIVKAPVSSVITPYNSGFTGWAPILQWMFNF
jgi:hypothetical protein